MYNIGLFEKFICFTLHKLSLLICAALTLVSFLGERGENIPKTSTIPAFEIGFDHFSPAFAAMEDDYLFEDKKPTNVLISGRSDTVFISATIENKKTPTIKVVKSKKREFIAERSNYFVNFDGSIDFREIRANKLKRLFVTKRAKEELNGSKMISGEEFRFGPLASLVKENPTRHQPRGSAISPIKNNETNTGNTISPESEFHQKAQQLAYTLKEPSSNSAESHPKIFHVNGNIQLKEGLAFIGSMEISWVVGDYEKARGSINTPDASFNIKTNDLIGDIIISLYDTKDELIGEGVLDLTQFSANSSTISQNIEVRPINWNQAGQVLHVDSLGHKDIPAKPIKDVSIELYAFNEATKTQKDGTFEFHNWKKTNSRSLAIASKEGFKDSLFLIDSKTPAKIILFDNDYIDYYIDYLKDQGIYDIANRGMIYGHLSGAENLDGYEVKIHNLKPIYFMEAGPADLSLKETSSNGLFSFVDMNDGEYEVIVEKAGEIIDSKVVLVEQGKISPVLLDLKSINKHIEFYDPMNPEREISSINLSFFDGVATKDLKNSVLKTEIKGGNDPVLIDYANDLEISRSFLSRTKSLQRLPLLGDNTLLNLAKKKGLSIKQGLVFGFVESSEHYLVDLIEGSPEKILYFDERAQPINPREKIAYGFILGGFPKGLSSLIIKSTKDSMTLATDLIFSEHEAISIVQGQVLTPE